MAQETSNGYFEGWAKISEVLNQSTSRRQWATTGMTATEFVDGEKYIAHTVLPASTDEDPSWLLGAGSILSDASVDMRSDCVEHSIDGLEESDLKISNEAERASFDCYQERISGGSDAHHSMHGPATWTQSCDNATSRSDTPNSSHACNDIFSIPSEAHEASDCSSMSVAGSRERHECYSEPVKDVPEICASTSPDDGGAPHSETEPHSIKYANAIFSKIASANRTNRTPLRLLYVIYALHGTELHLSEIHQEHPPVYLAFSHAWAQNVHIAATTRASLRKCDRNIPVTSLPDVIQDAVAITKTFGLSHLWIDAFCEYKTGQGRSDHIYELWTIFCEAYAMIISDVGALTFAEGLPGIRTIEIRMPSHREGLAEDSIWRRWLKNPLKPWTSLSKFRTSTNAGIHWATFDAGLGETCTKTQLFTRYGGKLFGITAPNTPHLASLFLEQGTEVYSSSQVVFNTSRSHEWYAYSISSLAFRGIGSSSLLAKTIRPGTSHTTQTPVSIPGGVGGGNSEYYGNCSVSNNGTGSGPKPEPASPSALREAGPGSETIDPLPEPAVDYVSAQASEHNGCKLRCPRLVADKRGPNCAPDICARHNHATVGEMKELHLRKISGHRYSLSELKIPRETGASERRKWDLLFLRVVHGWIPKDPSDPTIGQTYGEWLQSNPTFTEFPIPYLLNESGNCLGCHQPCYPVPASSASVASPVIRRQPLPQLAQTALDQTLLDPQLRVPEQSPGHQRRRPHLSPSRSSQDERSLHGGSSNKRRKTCSGSQGSNEATHASGNVLEEVDALGPQAVMRQSGEEVAESSTPSAQRSGSVERSTNATSRLTDVEPPSSPLPVEKLCSCPDWKVVAEPHFFCHGKDFCNCCSNFKAWSEKGEAVLRQLPNEICRCKDWPVENFYDPHVRCHGKHRCDCCEKWKAYSERGQRFLISHGRA